MYIILIAAVLGMAPSNMELAEEALTLSLQGIPDSLQNYEVNEIKIELSGEHAGNWLVEQTVSAVLHEHSIGVGGRDSGSVSGMVLRIRPMEITVEYGDVSRSWVIGAKKVERIARCELSLTLLDPQQEVLMTERTSGVVEDVISWSDADILKGSEEWAWLSRELPENSGGGILEPIVVSGVVASLVYLFYSSRAD